MGSFMMMGLFGLIIGSLVNMFLASSGFQFVLTIGGVLIFAGLTAWDTQKLKSMYSSAPQCRRGREARHLRCARPLSRLHQPVPDDVAPARRPSLSRPSGEAGISLRRSCVKASAVHEVRLRLVEGRDIPSIGDIYREACGSAAPPSNSTAR